MTQVPVDTGALDTDVEPADTGSGETGAADTGPDCRVDADGDGVDACADCDDADPAVRPGAVERCNGIDDDCDGQLHPDEVDGDGDGLPDCGLCDAQGYWAPTLGLTGSTLRTALYGLTAGHTCSSYAVERLHMFTVLDPVGGQVTCVYTGRSTPVGATVPPATDMNTEHSWPQSQGASTAPAQCDLHHLFPVDASANSRRSNHPYGVVAGAPLWEDGSRYGDDAAGLRVFEPRDAHKGNAARAMLWFGMRYAFVIEPSQRALYQTWSALDPVDLAERERTLAIAARQGRANPFVVCPSLVDRL